MRAERIRSQCWRANSGNASMDMPSIPAAPRLALTRFHASCMFSRDRICSNRLTCAPPCFPFGSSNPSASPFGVVAEGCGPVVEGHLSGSGLPAKALAVLCPRLTPRSACASGASPDKNANCSCTTPAFTSVPEPGASMRCAISPGPSALYAVPVRGLTTLNSGFLSTVSYPPAVAFI